MKASEMTNEMLAKHIEHIAALLPCYGGFVCAEELHEAAKRLRRSVVERYDAAVKLLDSELNKQKHCRNCEWRGKTIRSEPACPCPKDEHQSVFDIDITDRFAKALRGDTGEGAEDGNQ